MELNFNHGGAWRPSYNVYQEPPVPMPATSPFGYPFTSSQVPGPHKGSSSAPASTARSSTPITDQVLVYLKVFNPKDFTMYTLRRFNTDEMGTPDDIKEAIFIEVGDSAVSRRLDFPVGYFNKSNKLWLNNVQDVQAALALLFKNQKLTLWCMGIGKRKRSANDSDIDDDEEEQTIRPKKRRVSSASEEKASRVIGVKSELREQHGTKYSMVQYALWAEMIIGGTHESTDEPPPVPMLNAHRPRGRRNSGLGNTLTTVANKIATALSPAPTVSSSAGSMSSPLKNVELRGRYIHQLKDLVNLRDIGALTDDEYEEQRLHVVNLMRNLGK